MIKLKIFVVKIDAVNTRFITYYDQERSIKANKVKDINNLSEVQTALKMQ